jgi:hypothetical protein
MFHSFRKGKYIDVEVVKDMIKEVVSYDKSHVAYVDTLWNNE